MVYGYCLTRLSQFTTICKPCRTFYIGIKFKIRIDMLQQVRFIFLQIFRHLSCSIRLLSRGPPASTLWPLNVDKQQTFHQESITFNLTFDGGFFTLTLYGGWLYTHYFHMWKKLKKSIFGGNYFAWWNTAKFRNL